MAFKVTITETATEDLMEIVSFIARNSRRRAEQFSSVLIGRARSAAAFPEAGRMMPELGEPNVREILHGSYRIIYEIQRDTSTIYILRFWHSARGKPEVWLSGED